MMTVQYQHEARRAGRLEERLRKLHREMAAVASQRHVAEAERDTCRADAEVTSKLLGSLADRFQNGEQLTEEEKQQS